MPRNGREKEIIDLNEGDYVIEDMNMSIKGEIDIIRKQIRDLMRRKEELRDGDGNKEYKRQQIKEINEELSKAYEKLNQIKQNSDVKEVVAEEEVVVAKEVEEVEEKSTDLKKIIRELKQLNEKLKQSAKNRNEYRQKGEYDLEANERRSYTILIEKINKLEKVKLNEVARIDAELEKLKDQLKESATARSIHRARGQNDLEMIERAQYNKLVQEISELEDSRKPYTDDINLQKITRRINQLRALMRKSKNLRDIYKAEKHTDLEMMEYKKYTDFLEELSKLEKEEEKLNEKLYSDKKTTVKPKSKVLTPEEIEQQRAEKCKELEEKINRIGEVDYLKLMANLPEEIVDKFVNDIDTLSVQDIDTIFSKIEEMQIQLAPEKETEPEESHYPGTEPNPPIPQALPPLPKESRLEKIGNWFSGAWKKISNFVLFKPFKLVFKVGKALGKKFIEAMKLNPEEMEEETWDGRHDKYFTDNREEAKMQRKLAADIRDILNNKDGRKETFEYRGVKIQNTGSLKIIADFLEGKRKIEGRGRLITPEEGDYRLRLKPDGSLEPDYEHPLKPKQDFDESLRSEETAKKVGTKEKIEQLLEGEKDFSAAGKEGIKNIKVNPNYLGDDR